ncbi:MAG: SDR family oxidoreductase [Nocardioides sp.]
MTSRETVTDLFRLDDKVVVVTGASSGLGVAFAQAFAEAGADVVLGARRADRLAETAALVEAAGRRAVTLPTDVTDPAQCQALVDLAVAELGRVDVLVNNAGVGTAVPATKETPEQFRQVIDVNLNGCYWMAQACGRVMAPGSSIVNISSVLGLTTAGLPQAAYSASKAGLIGLTRDLAQQWTGRRGIRANALAPGFFRHRDDRAVSPGVPRRHGVADPRRASRRSARAGGDRGVAGLPPPATSRGRPSPSTAASPLPDRRRALGAAKQPCQLADLGRGDPAAAADQPAPSATQPSAAAGRQGRRPRPVPAGAVPALAAVGVDHDRPSRRGVRRRHRAAAAVSRVQQFTPTASTSGTSRAIAQGLGQRRPARRVRSPSAVSDSASRAPPGRRPPRAPPPPRPGSGPSRPRAGPPRPRRAPPGAAGARRADPPRRGRSRRRTPALSPSAAP